MKKFSLVLALVFVFNPFLSARAGGSYATYPYRLDGRLKTKVTFYDAQTIKLRVIKNRKKDYSYPVGSVFTGHILGHNDRRRLSLDEVETFQLDTVRIPGELQARQLINKKIKIKPEDYLNYMWKVGGLSFLTAGVILSITVDAFALGVPVGRGGFSAWYAVYKASESSQDQSKVKEGIKGFFQGALFPVPQLVMKGDELEVHKDSIIYLGKDPRNNIAARTTRFFTKLFYKDKTPYIKAALIKKFN